MTLSLDVKKLVPLGIIINELITNMMKHAFSGREEGRITISASMNGERAVILIGDNGNGLPESINFKNSSGFGMQLVGMLTEQLGGSIKIEQDMGTKFILEFDL